MDLTSRSFPLSKDPVLPPFEGDDLRRLAQEITKARRFLWKAQSCRYTLQAAPPTCLVALGHPDPRGLLKTRCSLVMGAFLQELLPCCSPPNPEIWASRRPSYFISCPLGPNSRKKQHRTKCYSSLDKCSQVRGGDSLSVLYISSKGHTACPVS